MGTSNEVKVAFKAKGHPNIRATHGSTLEVTAETDLTIRGDCIIGVQAAHSAQTLQVLLGSIIRKPECQIYTAFSAGGLTEEILGFGSSAITLGAKDSLVWRTSSYVDERTIAIKCDKAAKDLKRNLIRCLQNPATTLHVLMIASVPSK